MLRAVRQAYFDLNGRLFSYTLGTQFDPADAGSTKHTLVGMLGFSCTLGTQFDPHIGADARSGKHILI